MKKKVFFLMTVMIMISQMVLGQKVTVLPIMPVVSLHGSYTIEQLNYFILSDRPIVSDWVNDFVASCSEDLMEEDVFLPDTLKDKEKAILIIREYCYLDTVDLDAGFQNSGRDKAGKDNNLIYFSDKRNLKETVVLRLKYRSIDKIKIKMNCFNLLGGAPKGLDLSPKNKKDPGLVPDPKPDPSGLVPVPEEPEEFECLVESFTADPDTIRKGQKSILSWKVENADFVRISGINLDLDLEGNVDVYPRFRGRQKSAMYTLDVFKDNKLCKTEIVFIYKQDKTWLGKNWPWIAGTVAGTAVGVGFIAHGDGIWYGLGGNNAVIPVEEFNPVDALPQARMKGFTFYINF